MKIIITEQQLKSIVTPKKESANTIADSLWNSVIGLGTDEEGFYNSLKNIKTQELFNQVSDILKSTHDQNFYEIVNEYLEFTDEEKNKIIGILNSNNLPHNIVDGEIKPIQDLDYLINNNINFRRQIVAATLIGEAGGETHPDAMKAVLSVLSNRTKSPKFKDRGKYMAQQALSRKQFSCWNPVPRTYEGIVSYISSKKKHPKWKDAYNLVSNPNVEDVTRGALNYYASKGANKMSAEDKSRHSWIADLGATKQIGSHTFGTPTP